MELNFERRQYDTTKNVLWLCRNHPSAKTSYKALLFLYWEWIDGLMQRDPSTQICFIHEKDILKLTPPESITRAFRKLVEEGRIELTEEERARRGALEAEYRGYYGGRQHEF